MNSILFQLVFIGALLLGVASAAINADSNYCATYTTNTVCFQNSQYCHWDTASSTCIAGSPTTCVEFGADTVGCAKQSHCKIDTATNLCRDLLPTCDLVPKLDCLSRGDCHIVGENCVDGPVVNSCGTHTTQQTCIENLCLWDPFINSGSCWHSHAEVDNRYPCAAWSNQVPDADGQNKACLFHSCGYVLGECIDVGTYDATEGGSGVISFGVNAAFINPRVETGTLTFRIDVKTEATAFLNSQIHWPMFQVGSTTALPTATNGATYKKQCGSVDTYSATPPVPLYPNNYDIGFQDSSMVSALTAYINDKHDLQFTGTTYETQLRRAYGTQMKIGGGSVVENVTVSTTSSGAIMQYTLAFDLNMISSNCTGASKTVMTGYDEYKFDIFYVERNQYDGLGVAKYSQKVTVSTGGTIVVGETNRYQPTAYVKSVASAQLFCAAGYNKMFITYGVDYTGVYDTTKYVGPIPGAVYLNRDPNNNNVLTSCYGDSLSTLSSPLCNGETCHVDITVTSRCMKLRSDGETYDKCAYLDDNYKITDLGAADQSYAQYDIDDLDHSFWLDEYICDRTQAISGDYSSCIRVDQRTTPAYRKIKAILDIQAYAPQTEEVVYQIEGGFLPSVRSKFEDRVAISLSNSTTGPETSGSFLNQDPNHVYTSLNFIVYLKNDDIRARADLRINIDGFSFMVVPISNEGAPLTLSNCPTSISWLNLRNKVTYTVKNGKTDCVGCFTLPACDGIKGCDGFVVSSSALQEICPNQASWRFILETTISMETSDTPASRRLLAADDETSGTHVYATTSSVDITFDVTGIKETAKTDLIARVSVLVWGSSAAYLLIFIATYYFIQVYPKRNYTPMIGSASASA